MPIASQSCTRVSFKQAWLWVLGLRIQFHSPRCMSLDVYLSYRRVKCTYVGSCGSYFYLSTLTLNSQTYLTSPNLWSLVNNCLSLCCQHGANNIYHPSNQSLIHPSIQPPTQPPIHQLILPSVHPSIRPSISFVLGIYDLLNSESLDHWSTHFFLLYLCNALTLIQRQTAKKKEKSKLKYSTRILWVTYPSCLFLFHFFTLSFCALFCFAETFCLTFFLHPSAHNCFISFLSSN